MRRRILLADDSVTIQKVIELTFLDEDYEVRAVSNGDAAVAALAELRPDFVIADVHMPGANGYEVCRRAKQLHPGVPVLLLVGTFEPFDEGQMRQVGADSYLKKPFDSQELLERVEALLGRPAAVTSAPPPGFAAPPAPPEFTAPPPPAPYVVPAPEPELPAFELPPVAGFPAPAAAAAPAAFSDLSEFSLEPTPGTPGEPPAPFAAEPLWGFESAPAPATAPPPEPFDREPNFELGPPPAFAVREEEPLFTFDDTASQPLQLAPEPAWTAGEGAAASTELPPFDASLAWSPEPTPEVRFEPEPAPTAAWSIPQLPATPAAEPALAAWPAPPPVIAAPPPSLPPVTEPPPATPATPTTTAPAPAATNGGGRLSEEDVDRIAHRLVQLLGDKAIRDIAWEVVPDLAEVIIRDRLRELEGQAELL